MKDDFDSDANEKEVEQFGIWVKKAPEDVIDTPSGDTIQNSPDSLDSDDSFNQNEISDSSFLQDLPEPDFDGISDLDTNENITDTEQITDSDFSVDNDSVNSEQPAFSEPEPAEPAPAAAPAPAEASFQDFQEEDSAENWEPLDDAPNFNYPSVDNITVPPLEEPSETEIENSMQSANDASDQKEEAFDEINLTEDSSFDKLETATADTSNQDDDIPDFDIDEPVADEDDDKPINLDDSFDLPDFGSTPETEDYGNSENAEPIALTDDLMNLPDFGSTPETEDFGIVKGDIEENSDFSPIEPEDSSISETSEDAAKTDLAEEPEASDNIEADISTELPPFESISGEETADTAAEPAETKDDFDTAFDSESISESSSEPVIDGIVADAGSFSDAAQFADIEMPETSPAADEAPAAEDNFVPPEPSEKGGSNENETEELSLDDFLSDSGEIDVSDEFGLSSGDSSDVTDDFLSDLNAEFGGSSESKSDLMDEEPIDIDLEFDDKFAADVQADASENIEDDSNFDEFFSDSGESSSVEDNFDDMFAAIQDESAPNANAAAAPSVDSLAEFDEVTEFDDFLSSDSGPDIETEKAHSNKINKQIDYDITVSQDDVNKTKQTTVEVSDDYETSESIPLYGTETDADGNKVAFIPKAEDENMPQKAALEKSEDDDFYENLFADAENMEDSTTPDVADKDTPPFDISSSVDDEEIVPITNSTEEQTMKEEQDMDITDKTLSDSPEVETSQIDDLTDSSSIVPEIVEDTDVSEINSFISQDESDNIIDVPDISLSPSDTEENNEIPESPALYDEPAVEADSAENIEPEELQIDDTFEPENLNIENDDEPLTPPEISEEAPATDGLSEDLSTDSSDFEIPALDEDETSEAPALSDEILPENEISDSEQPEQNDGEPEIQEETTAQEDIVIPTLNEGDEDFVDAAALADSLAETDKLESEGAEPAEFSELSGPDDVTPTFDDITSSKENSDNDLPSFDDITTDTADNNFIAPGLEATDSLDTESALTDDPAEEPVAENDISNASLYNSILSETFPEASEDNDNETDKNLLDIADNSEYTEDKEDEHNMDFDENNLDSGITEQSTTGAPEQTSNISEAVLKEISNELSMLRSEISLLKEELANVRHDSLNLHDSSTNNEAEEPQEADAFNAGTEEPVLDNLEQSEEAPVVVESESSTGFFDGDVEDETIALSGDELSNILNTADFTEEFVDNNGAADQNEISDEVPTAPETMDFDEQTLEEPGDLEIQELDQNSENEEISVPNVDDIIVDSDDDGFVANIEPETEDSISNDELQYLSEEPKAEEIYDTPAEITEEASEPEALEVETVDEQEAPVEETEEVVLESDVGPFSEADETPTEAVFESDQWNEDSAKSETPAEEAAPAEEVSETPVEETIEPAAEATESDSVDSMRVKAEQFADADQKDLKEEIKSVLLYMDQLLENLPDEKIEEFAQSSYFETYKKLFKELGIS